MAIGSNNNTGGQSSSGFYWLSTASGAKTNYFINCLAHNCDGHGFVTWSNQADQNHSFPQYQPSQNPHQAYLLMI